MKKQKNTLCLTALMIILTLAVALFMPAVPFAMAVPDADGIFVDFEDGTTMGFEARNENDTSILTVTDELAHSGTYSLLTTGRTSAWHGPSVNVADYIIPGNSYTISVMVHAKTPDSSQFRMSTQIGQGNTVSYDNIQMKNIRVSDGWVQMTGTYTFPVEDYITIYVENDVAGAEFYIDDLEFYSGAGGAFAADTNLPSLAEIYNGQFLIGSAFSRSDLAGPRFELIKHHFNVMTAGNDMKPVALTGSEKGTYNFDRADAMLVPFEEAGILIHGHTLVWHSQSRAWLNKDENGEFLTRQQARENMEEFINTIAGHFKGRVISWDVVNEAFQNSVDSSGASNWRSGLRKGGTSNDSSAWFGAYANGANADEGESGADYIYDAFVFTRLADPDAILYYNDFNETEEFKRNAIAAMTEELNGKWAEDPRNEDPDRLLIEGLGMQAHYWTDNLKPEDVESTIIRWKRTGAEISITELDIPAGSYNNYKELTREEEIKQANLYAQLFKIFKKHSDDIARITIWGIDDATSWRSGGSPLLFDVNGNAKRSFFAVMDPEGFLDGFYLGENPAVIIPAEPTPEPTPEPAQAPETTPAPSSPTPEPTTETETKTNITLTVILIMISAAVILGVVITGVILVLKKRSGKQ